MLQLHGNNGVMIINTWTSVKYSSPGFIAEQSAKFASIFMGPLWKMCETLPFLSVTNQQGQLNCLLFFRCSSLIFQYYTNMTDIHTIFMILQKTKQFLYWANALDSALLERFVELGRPISELPAPLTLLRPVSHTPFPCILLSWSRMESSFFFHQVATETTYYCEKSLVTN